MLLHIGEDHYLGAGDLSLILNIKTVIYAGSATSLNPAKWQKISENRTKSLIITKDNQIIESPIDSLTLRKREDVLGFVRGNL